MPRPAKPWYRVQKNGWYATAGGRVVSLGVQGRGNRRAALDAWYRLMADGGKDAPTTPQAVLLVAPATKSAAPSVAELGAAFLADARSRLKPTTLVWYERSVEGLTAVFGTTPADALAVGDAEHWLRGTRWGETTRNHVIGVLNVFFSWCVRRRLLAANPIAGIAKPPKRSRGDDAVISADDHARLLAAASPQFRDVLAILHATGARPSEAIAITAENFDPAAGVVRLREHKTAHRGKSRALYLTPAAVRLLSGLRERHRTGPLLRNGHGRPWRKDAIVLAMSRLRGRTGVKATAYGYRHTFATDALAAGVPDAQVAELLGHSSTAMLHRHYSHLATKVKVLTDAVKTVR